METVTIRNFREKTKQALRVRAAKHGRSMEEEARVILDRAVEGTAPAPTNLADAIAAIFDPLGGIDLDLPRRQTNRPLPKFDDEADTP